MNGMPDSYSGLQLANGRVRLASWRLPYSEPEILANRRDQIAIDDFKESLITSPKVGKYDYACLLAIEKL